MEEEKKKLPICFRCVHLQSTEEKVPFTDIPLYKCYFFVTEITVERSTLDCTNFYDGSYE